jgi:hypothetical protein
MTKVDAIPCASKHSRSRARSECVISMIEALPGKVSDGH